VKTHRHAETETPSDPELASVINAWPTLPADVKASILALARSGGLVGRENEPAL